MIDPVDDDIRLVFIGSAHHAVVFEAALSRRRKLPKAGV